MYGAGSSDSDGRIHVVGACPTPTGSVGAVVCVADRLACGVVHPSASPPTGGRGGLRENCRTLVSYAFRRAKFFYKRRVRRVKEMLRIWVFLKKKNTPPPTEHPPPADAQNGRRNAPRKKNKPSPSGTKQTPNRGGFSAFIRMYVFANMP